MDNDYFIKLTLSVYRVTGLFPEREPLKSQIREMANQILVELICAKSGGLKGGLINTSIQKIKALLRVASFQNWVKEENILIILKEYDRILERLSAKETLETKESPDAVLGSKQSIKPIQKTKKTDLVFVVRVPPEKRQEKIMNLLNYKKRINLSELKRVFSGVSPRTLRRDMELLAKNGLVSRKRDGQKDVAYWLAENRTEHPTNADNGNQNQLMSELN